MLLHSSSPSSSSSLSAVLLHLLTSSAANYAVGSSSVSTQIKEKMNISESLFLRDI